jgi:hypothetical protein
MESIEQTFNGTADFGKKVTVTVSRNGDLITKVYLQSAIPGVSVSDLSGFRWIDEVGHFLIKTVEVEIGGQRIDKHYGTWLSIWSSLTTTQGHLSGYNSMIGNSGDLQDPTLSATGSGDDHPGQTLYVPLRFWFCRHTGLALPLIALQYHEVKFSIEFETFANLTDPDYANALTTPSLGDTSLYIDYIYLDTDERRRFAQISHEYLIEQLQFTGDESLSGTSNRVKLNFNHPVKELVWVVQSAEDRLFANYTDLADGSGSNPCDTAKLQLNGHDRFSVREGEYFNLVQPYQHHENIPATGINVYSFALKPEEQQPSGSANMSRIDNATLQLTITGAANSDDPIAKIYATNYNVLRIMSGMGGLAYSN